MWGDRMYVRCSIFYESAFGKWIKYALEVWKMGYVIVGGIRVFPLKVVVL